MVNDFDISERCESGTVCDDGLDGFVREGLAVPDIKIREGISW